MKLRLDDNANEAFRFLVLGAGTVLLLRILYWAANQWLHPPLDTDDLARTASAFRNGYLLTDPYSMVVGGMDVMGRSALGMVFTLSAAAFLGLTGAVLARALGRAPLRMAVHGARLGIVVTGTWSLFAILFLPPRTTVFGEHALVLRQRPAFLDELTLPLPVRETTVPFAEVSAVQARTVASTLAGCGSQEQVVLRQGDPLLVIAQLVPEGPQCDDALSDAREQTLRLARALEVRMGR